VPRRPAAPSAVEGSFAAVRRCRLPRACRGVQAAATGGGRRCRLPRACRGVVGARPACSERGRAAAPGGDAGWSCGRGYVLPCGPASASPTDSLTRPGMELAKGPMPAPTADVQSRVRWPAARLATLASRPPVCGLTVQPPCAKVADVEHFARQLSPRERKAQEDGRQNRTMHNSPTPPGSEAGLHVRDSGYSGIVRATRRISFFVPADSRE